MYNLVVEENLNPGLFIPMVQKIMVEKSGVERSGVEAWGLNSFNPIWYIHSFCQ